MGMTNNKNKIGVELKFCNYSGVDLTSDQLNKGALE